MLKATEQSYSTEIFCYKLHSGLKQNPSQEDLLEGCLGSTKEGIKAG